MEYEVIRTDTADAGIRKIILYIAQNFGNEVALEQLDYIEKKILELGNDPYIGTPVCQAHDKKIYNFFEVFRAAS